MSKRVKIEIEFERDDIEDVDVEEHLIELIENGGLDWEIEEEFITTEAITNSDDIPMALPLENLIKIKAWQNMYDAHSVHNYESDHYPEFAYEQINLMDEYYSQAERIVTEVLEYGN
jgi:hypothetical protein